MKASGKVGIGKVVLRDREETVMIAAQDGGIMLYKLRQPNEVRKMDDVPQIERREVNKDELKLSISLVESMASSLKEIDLTDRYRDALREMIKYIVRATGLSAADAYSLCSVIADMHVTQLVNVSKGIHVMLAKSHLRAG